MLNERFQRWSYLIPPLVFFIISIVWSQLTIDTWDDDAATRFFATLRAGENPQNFLDSWLRPLFVQVFYLPIHFFGRTGLVVAMSLLTAVSSILLYKGLLAKGVNSAYAAMLFHLSQTFLFGITRDAMTEPLAAFILSLGCYFYLTEKWGWFAVAGSFLPLARTEMVLLLPIWAWILFSQKKYKQILLLGTGLAILFIAWTVYAGNLHAFFDNNIRGTDAPNRYARTSVDHYFNKLAYVVGPVTFLFLLLGYVSRIKTIFSDYFFMLQFTVGFLMYVVFGSADISLGQAAGFLRHLVTFAPLVAVIALYGLQFWMGVINTPAPVVQAKSDKKKAKLKREAASTGNTLSAKKLLITLFLFVFLVLCFKMLPYKLLYRQFYSEEEKDFTILYFIIAAVSVVFISLWVGKLKSPIIWAVVIFILQTSFTFYHERPGGHKNEERAALTSAADWVLQCDLDKRPVYCNHQWFYWTLMGRNDLRLTQKGIDSASLKRMAPGSIVVWESHYTNKNYSNIPQEMVLKDTSFIMINYVQDSEKAMRGFVFMKDAGPAANRGVWDKITSSDSTNASVFLLRGIYEKGKVKDLASSIKSLDKAIALNNGLADAYYHRGECYLIQSQADRACPDLRMAKSLGNRDADRMLNQFCLGK